jgi:hypothetical protein
VPDPACANAACITFTQTCHQGHCYTNGDPCLQIRCPNNGLCVNGVCQ